MGDSQKLGTVKTSERKAECLKTEMLDCITN